MHNSGLTTVGLIHMNGRIYDPILRQFMSPDNYVQDPYNTQNFNRFGYVLNNPLLYTDPSGELAFLAVVGIAAAVGILTTAIANISAGIPFWHGMGKAAVVGAISGAISFGIGEAVTGITSFWAKAGLQAGMHGMKSGMMSAIEGGSFLSGFAAGAISSLVSSGVEALGTNFSGSGSFRTVDGGFSPNSFGAGAGIKAVMIASGGLSGGISSSIAGGSFWKGVREGLITSGLNHVLHSLAPNKNAVKRLNKELKDEFGADLDGKADISQKTLNRIMKLKIFKKFFKMSGSKVSVEFIDESYAPDSEGGGIANYTTLRERNGEAYTGSDDGRIAMYRNSFSTNRGTAGVLLHEFGHAISRHRGIFARSYNKTNWSVAVALDEVFAYSFQHLFGFSFYQDGSRMFNIQLQISLNRIDRWYGK